MTSLSTDPQFVFIHIPKNAGTAFTKAIESKNCAQFNAAKTHVKLKQVLHARPEFRGAPVIAIFRNPWERLWSMYNNRLNALERRIRRRHRDPRKVKAWTSEAGDRNQIEEMERLGFNNWVTEGPPVSKHNTISQLAWADSPDLIPLQFTNLADDLGKVSHLLPRLKLPQIKVTNYAYRDYRDQYSREARELVARVYAPDIERFGYSFEEMPTPRLPLGWHGKVTSLIGSDW